MTPGRMRVQVYKASRNICGKNLTRICLICKIWMMDRTRWLIGSLTGARILWCIQNGQTLGGSNLKYVRRGWLNMCQGKGVPYEPLGERLSPKLSDKWYKLPLPLERGNMTCGGRSEVQSLEHKVLCLRDYYEIVRFGNQMSILCNML